MTGSRREGAWWTEKDRRARKRIEEEGDERGKEGVKECGRKEGENGERGGW
jgi:hypothetical protein